MHRILDERPAPARGHGRSAEAFRAVLRTSPFVVVLAVACLPGCSSAGFVSTWKEPLDAPVELQGKRVAAIVMHQDASVRRSAESDLARQISKQGAQGIAAYYLYQDDPPEDQGTVRKMLEDANVAGAAIMRPVGTDEEPSYDPEGTRWFSKPHYATFYGYWGWGWAAAYSPGDLRTDAIVRVETLVYSVEDDKLLWGGVSKTTVPSNIGEFVRELGDAVASEMRKAGFIS